MVNWSLFEVIPESAELPPCSVLPEKKRTRPRDPQEFTISVSLHNVWGQTTVWVLIYLSTMFFWVGTLQSWNPVHALIFFTSNIRFTNALYGTFGGSGPMTVRISLDSDGKIWQSALLQKDGRAGWVFMRIISLYRKLECAKREQLEKLLALYDTIKTCIAWSKKFHTCSGSM